MSAFRAVLLGGIVSCAASLVFAETPSVFDKPSHEVQIALPPNPDSPGSKPMLSCFYYPRLMVKQVDLGELGAEQLSIVPVPLGREEPPCVRTNAKNEIVIDPKVWSGYFEGVKGDFVFFTAEDGFNGGMSFGVFNSDGAKIFEDSIRVEGRSFGFVSIKLPSDPKSDVESVLTLRYKRVHVAQCSLRGDEKYCWSRIKEITGLAKAIPPNCAPAYEAEKKRLPEYANSVDSYPSVIAYDVEAVVDRRNSVVRVSPTSNATECYLGD